MKNPLLGFGLIVLLAANSAMCAASPPDFDNSGTVDVLDLQDFSDSWLDSGDIPENLDGVGKVDFADFAIFASWWLRDVPPIANPEGYYVSRNGVLTVAEPGVLANDVDLQGDPLSAILVSGVSHGTLHHLNPDGSFSYTPNAGYTGLDTFTYKASDGTDNSNITTVTLTIASPPNLLVNADFEIGTPETNKANPFDAPPWVRAYNSVPDIWLVDSPFEVDNQVVQSRWAGSWVYQDFDVTAGQDYPLSVEVYNWTGIESVEWDGLLRIEWLDGSDAVISGPTEVDRYVTLGGPRNTWVTLSGTETAPAGAVKGRISFINAHTPNSSGTGSLFYDNAGVFLEASAPVANDDSYNLFQDTSLDISAPGVIGNDADPQGDSLTATLDTGVSHGSLALNPDGSFLYEPTPGYVGPDSFTYTVSDGSESSNVATVSITVEPFLFTPVAVNDSYTTSKNTVLNTPAPGVLGNDTPADTGYPMTAVLVTGAGHGAVVLNLDGSFVYTPGAGYTGPDSFTYKVYDGDAYSNIGTVDIDILLPNPNVATTAWTYAAGAATTVAAARYSGLYAVADRATDTIEIRDIRESLLYTVTSAQIQAELGASSIAGNDYGVCALAFSASGRQLYISVCGQSNDAVLAFNTGTGVLRTFKDGLALASSMNSGNLGLAHHKGVLYVGTSTGDILIYQALMNDMTATLLDTMSFSGADGGLPVQGIAVDTYDEKLYVASPNRLYRVDPTAASPALTEIALSSNISAISYGRTYGGSGQGGLYVLRDSGSRSFDFASMASLRAGGSVTLGNYHNTTDAIADISATACGRLLLAATAAEMMSDSTDTRMDFETWLQDEFDQYVLFAKTLCWPDGEPEGWVINSNKRLGLNRGHPASPDAANWVLLMLLMADEVNGDTEAKGMVRAIVKRYAGLSADGIAPVIVPDGHFYHWYADDGSTTWNATVTSIYSTMKPICMAIRAKEYYPDDPEIVAAANKIIYGIKNSRDFIRDFGGSKGAADDLGPIVAGGLARPYQETGMWSEQTAARDPMCIGAHLDYWRYRSSHPNDNTLTGEPIIRSNASGFWEMYDASVLKFWREDPEWQQEFKNFYALFAAWTDDNAPHYLTAFSAGVNPDSYNADKFTNHPWTITSFGTVLGFGLNGNTVPVAGGYFAYRDGARQALEGSDAYSGANTLTRYSNEDPSWQMNSISPTDHQYGGYALGELLSPGSVNRAIALNTYLPQLEQGTTPSGQVRLDFTKMLRHRILGSDDGVNWTSYGFQETPFVFDTGVSYSQYQTVEPEGVFVDISNSDFENGLTDWTQSGDSLFYTTSVASDHIVGQSAVIHTHTGMTSPEGTLTQTIALSADFETTQFIVRGDGYVATAGAPGDGYLRIQWDADANAGNGVIGSAEQSNGMDSANRRVEFRIDSTKPAGANYIHLSCVVEPGTPTLHRYIFDNLSIVCLGADISFANSGFEDGDVGGWTTDYPGSTSSLSVTSDPAWVLEGTYAARWELEPSMSNGDTATLSRDYDISADPVETRYILQTAVKTGNLQGSYVYLEIYLDDNLVDPYLRTEQGDTFEHANTTSEIFQSISKRDGSAAMLRLFVTVKRTDSSAVTANEYVALDDIKLIKKPR